MSVPLPNGRTPEDIVNFVAAANDHGQDHAALVAALSAEFGLSVADAELAIERVGGGMFRAFLGDPANCPDKAKDPIAWASFQRVIESRDQSA